MVTDGRYKTLDAFRAVAALAVLLFHCTNTVVRPEMGWWARALLQTWIGVFVFFPISGYCVFAAVSRSRTMTVGQFLRRRWRRTVFPYWASLGVCVVAAVVATRITHGGLDYLNLGLRKWLAVATLTQGFVGMGQVVNPVYWSLCLEEQFYLVMALALILPTDQRIRLLFGVTAAAGVYNAARWPEAWRVTGLFLEYWLSFSAGLAAFIWLRWPERRRWAVALFTVIVARIVTARDVPLAISFATSIAFIVLAPHDEALSATGAGASLIWVGAMSYSLYLVHVPIAGRVVNLLRHQGWPLLIPSLFAIPVGLATAGCFYWAVERRFMNAPSRVVKNDGRLGRVA